MATMTSMFQQMIDKIADQAAKIGVLKHEKTDLEKKAQRMQEVIIRPEKSIQRHEAKMEDALDIIESLAAEEIIELCVYWQNAQAFIKKWTPPKDHFMEEAVSLPNGAIAVAVEQKEASYGERRPTQT